jgi:hypothetical protein
VRFIHFIGVIFLCLLMSTSSLHAQEQGKDSQELLDRIETLEKQLKKMEDETKARKSLEVTEEEKTGQEKEVLEAVGRDYSLSPKGTLSIDYSLSYSYSPSQTIYTADQLLRLESEADHTIQHSIYTSYSVLDNLTTSLNVPIVYRYNKLGTDSHLDQTDIGDMGLGLAFQTPPAWTWLKIPGDIRSTYSFGATLPTGRSPYKINPKTELSTGGGLYSLSLGGSFSKQVDPVVLFWNLGYSYPFDRSNLNYLVQQKYTLDKVETGSTFSFGMGMGYSLSYANSLNMSFNYSYQLSSTLKYKELTTPIKTGDRVSATFGVGMGLMVTPKTLMSVSLGYSLASEGFSLSLRVPFDFAI